MILERMYMQVYFLRNENRPCVHQGKSVCLVGYLLCWKVYSCVGCIAGKGVSCILMKGVCAECTVEII